MTLEELDQIEAGLKHWQRPGDWGLKLVEDFRTTLLQLSEARAQVEKEHECAGELQAGLVKQYGEFAAEIDAKEQMRKETADALDAVRKELTEKDRLYHELSDAIQNLLKAPHNSFNDAMWREKIKGLLTPEVKRKCAHCGSESKNVTCSVCIGA